MDEARGRWIRTPASPITSAARPDIKIILVSGRKEPGDGREKGDAVDPLVGSAGSTGQGACRRDTRVSERGEPPAPAIGAR